MRLRAYDTIHISAVRADNIRPGDEIDVSDATGAELMKAHPGIFAIVSQEKAEPEPQNKAEPAAPENKAEAGPSVTTSRRGSRG